MMPRTLLTQSHEYIAKFLADLAILYGIPTRTSVKNHFTPLICNFLGQLGPGFQNFLWDIANHAAKNQISTNLLDKPCLDAQTPDNAIFQKLRSFIYLQALDKILVPIFEGVTEITVEHLH